MAVIHGATGSDDLSGTSGDALIHGGSPSGNGFLDFGNDILRSLDGNDQLDGGPGQGTLIGGDGHDFIVGARDGEDHHFALMQRT
jgi:Ca2+-binding RTX toxin-like protein